MFNHDNSIAKGLEKDFIIRHCLHKVLKIFSLLNSKIAKKILKEKNRNNLHIWEFSRHIHYNFLKEDHKGSFHTKNYENL